MQELQLLIWRRRRWRATRKLIVEGFQACARLCGGSGCKGYAEARAVTDFDYEFQLTGMNRSLMPEVETVFPPQR